MNSPYTIAILGLWHLGEVYSVCLAELGHHVIGISNDTALIAKLQKNIPPLQEPNVVELLERNQEAGRLLFTTDYSMIQEANIVWLTFDTPINNEDEIDLSLIYKTIDEIIPHLKDGVMLAVSSQLPVGTSVKIQEMVHTARPELQFNYLYTPENLRLGEAVSCFMKPGRIVVGIDTDTALETAKNVFSKLHAEVISMSPASAEMAKHALNSWLATSISFTNDLADVCEWVGADIEDVLKALKSDSRIGPKAYLFPGLGFSGGTLGRDLKALMAVARNKGYELPMIAATYAKNQLRGRVIQNRLEQEWGSVAGKDIAMFGITYKAGTATLRRSQPLLIETQLRAAGARMRLCDPLAIPEEVAQATPSPFFRDPYETAKQSDIILIMTPSYGHQSLDFQRLKDIMRMPLIFDTCNSLASHESEIVAAGVGYMRIGK